MSNKIVTPCARLARCRLPALLALALASACGSGTADGSGSSPPPAPEPVDSPSPAPQPTATPLVPSPASPSPPPRAGDLDSTFGEDGTVRSFAPGRRAVVVDGALQPDGRIVLLLGVSDPEREDDSLIGLARYEADGSTDASFGAGGFVEHSLCSDPASACRDLHARALLALPDGRLLIAVGDDQRGLAGRLLLMTADGRADPTFGDDGALTVPALIEDLALQEDGGVVGAGGSPDGFALLRLTPASRLDQRLGRNGLRFFDVAGGASLQVFGHVAVQADGKIVAAGMVRSPDLASALARFTPEGNPDPAFGRAGWLIDDVPHDLFGGVSAAAGPIALDGHDRLLVETPEDFATRRVRRLNVDGSIDASWAEPFESAHTLLAQADGGVLAASVRNVISFGLVIPINGVLRRYRSDGAGDPSFGDAAIVDLPLVDGRAVFVGAALQQADGKIVVASSAQDGSWVLLRFLS